MFNKVRIFVTILCLSLLTIESTHVAGKGVYLTAKVFIKEAFNGHLPSPSMLWLNKEEQTQIANLLEQKFNRIRVRYWAQNQETIWVLEEIGKEKPITFAIHVTHNKISKLKVLEYRESRGDEVRHDFFSNQFNNASLTEDQLLSQHIDGITGATLSVNAAKKVAKLALWLDNKVQSAS